MGQVVTKSMSVSRALATTFEIIEFAEEETENTLGGMLSADSNSTFEFAYIFLLGGVCPIEDYPNDWYSRWVTTGVNTLVGFGNRTNVQVICNDPEKFDNPYDRPFHLDALEQVQSIARDKLNETLVITVAIGLESDWTPVVDLLRQGMSFFHAKEDPHNFNITEYGLSPDEVLYFYFQWDEEAAARKSGKELCRLNQGVDVIKLAKIYQAGRNDSLNYRVDLALEEFKKECNDTEIIDLWTVYSDIEPKQLKALLKFNRVPDLVMTCQDAVARNVIDAAREMLTMSQYENLATTGWDYIEPNLTNSRQILTTVDQVVLYPNQGLWKVINDVLTVAEASNLRSTTAVQEFLRLGESLTITSDTLMISADMVGYLLDRLLGGYDTAAPPATVVQVSTGLDNVTVTEMEPFEGKFEANFWLVMSWKDPRLEWDAQTYNRELPIDSEMIWIPAVFYANEHAREDLYRGPAMARPDGTVTVATHVVVDFLCSTTDSLEAFPFDNYDCEIVLGAPHGIRLDAIFGFDLEDSDENFNTTYSVDESPQSAQTVVYMLRFERKLFTAYLRLIVPAVLINFVGFMAFWIPAPEESVALGVTSFLCVLAFRETVDVPETSDITWTEVFLMVNIFYQASVLFIIWASYSHTTGAARLLDSFCRRIHPQKAIRATYRSVEKKLTGKTLKRSTGQRELPKDKMTSNADFLTNKTTASTFQPSPSFLYTTPYDEGDEFATSELSKPRPNSPPSRRPSSASGTFDEGMSDRSRRHSIHAGAMNGEASGRNKRYSTLGVVDSDGNYTSLSNSMGSSGRIDAVGGRRTSKFLATLDEGSDDGSSTEMASMDDFAHKNSLRSRRSSGEKAESTMMDAYDNSPPVFSQPVFGDPGFASGDKPVDYYSDEESQEKAVKIKKVLDEEDHNVDWIGRWIIVPSYVVVVLSLILTGWGFFTNISDSWVISNYS